MSGELKNPWVTFSFSMGRKKPPGNTTPCIFVCLVLVSVGGEMGRKLTFG